MSRYQLECTLAAEEVLPLAKLWQFWVLDLLVRLIYVPEGLRMYHVHVSESIVTAANPSLSWTANNTSLVPYTMKSIVFFDTLTTWVVIPRLKITLHRGYFFQSNRSIPAML